MKLKLLLFIVPIILFFSCNAIKLTQKMANRSQISYYNDEKNFIEKWKKKWDKIFSVETEEYFKSQSNTILSKQMESLESFIKSGDEQASKTQADYVSTTKDYVKSKTPNIDYLNSINNLNDTYLSRAENLAKISKANQYAESRNFSAWQSKWNELSSNTINIQYQLDAFILQSNNLLGKQMSNIKEYISRGDESNSVSENNLIKDNYNYIRRKYPNYDKEYNKIDDLNDDFLTKVPILAKMERANIYQNNNDFSNWRNKWNEVVPYTVAVEHIKTEFLKQSKIVLNRQISQLNTFIQKADENRTLSTKNSLQDNYDFTRQKYPNFDVEYNDISNLNDYYLDGAVSLAKISAAKNFIKNHDFQKWIDKWSEIGTDISEQFLIDSFEVQSIIVFSTIYDEVLEAKNSQNCSLWEQKSDLLVNVLEQTYLIYNGFDNYCKTQPKLQNIKKDHLMRLNRDSKICIAENFLSQKNYISWINKWTEIENKQFLDDFEIGIFENHTKTGFGNLLEDIDKAIIVGNFQQTESLSNLTLDLYQSKVLAVNPNYEAQYSDLNEIYLFNAKFFASAQSQYLGGKFKESIQYLLQNCGDKLSTNELKPSFLDFFNQTLEKLVEIYKVSMQNTDFDKQVADLNTMNDIYNLKPEYLTIIYTPEYLNEGKKLKTFEIWLDWQLGATISNFFEHADSLINKNLYTLAYDFIFERAGKLPQTEETQEKINVYNNLFETQGTDYYKSQINLQISNNKYLIAKKILDDDLLKINSDFNSDRRNEYNQIVTDISNKGTNYYISQRDRMIQKQNWDLYCHKYCDSIEMINPTYDIERCHDEINFEKNYFVAMNNYNNGNYFCAIDIANELLSYNIDENRKSKARTLISDSKNEAVLTVGTFVTNNYLTDDLNSYVIGELQSYKGGYKFRDYLEIKNSGSSDFSINLVVDNFTYESGWNNTETKNACIIHTRNDERTRTITYNVKKTVVVGDFTYYEVKDAYGTVYWIRNVNGYDYFLTTEGTLAPVTFSWNYVYVEESQIETYTVKQYYYEQVNYKVNTGAEKMNFSAKTDIKDNSGGYTKYSQNSSFSKQINYSKYEVVGSYNVGDLVSCPSATLNTWLDQSYNCSSFDKSPFDAPSDPFRGKNEFYQSYLKDDLRGFIRQQIPKMMEYVKEKHNNMQCD